jgi:NTP pyrophosphatase (non-canonical NTP hydrolase)
MDSYETIVKAFGEEMVKRLQVNSYKGGWEKCPSDYLFKRLLEEVGELIESVLIGNTEASVLHEASDVANFAMMIADNYGATRKEAI